MVQKKSAAEDVEGMLGTAKRRGSDPAMGTGERQG